MATALRSAWHSVLTTTAVVLYLLILGANAPAAEPTEAERMAEQLKEAETHKDKLLADRWHKLVRQRQWVDSTGKHKTYARYVDHDPDLKWVKLSILVKKGADETYKESSVPVARLSKTDQAVVKRIAMVRKQVETALADAPAGAEGRLGEGAEEHMLAGESGREAYAPPEAVEAPIEAEPPVDPNLPAWRRDFNAFAANLSTGADPQSGQPSIQWGELAQLGAVHQQEQMLAALRAMPAEQRPVSMMMMLALQYQGALLGLGEVHWESSLTGSGAPGEELQHNLQPPAPFTISLVPDPKYSVDVSRFGRGEPVRFIGRFAGLGGFGATPQIKLFVRLPGDQPAAEPTAAAQEVLTGNEAAAPGVGEGRPPLESPVEAPAEGRPAFSRER